MFLAWLLTFTLATGSGPMNAALQATEAPTTLRAAFTVELQSSHARRVYRFDPRKKGRDRWTALAWEGEDEDGEGNGIFTPDDKGEADLAWIAYIVAEK